MKEFKLSIQKLIIGEIAFALCIFYFLLPIINVGFIGLFINLNDINVTSWEYVIGKKHFYNNPFALILFIIPALLFLSAITNKSFKTLGLISLIGLISKIFFWSITDTKLRHAFYIGEYSMNNWLYLFVYIGLCAFSFICSVLLVDGKNKE